MALATLRRAAVAELRHIVAAQGADFPAIDWVWRALQTRGKLLAGEDGFTWGLLPVLVCQAAGGDPEQALPVGAALECLIAATDILDDIEDSDAPDALWRGCGLPTAANVATFLLFLTPLALARLAEHRVAAERIGAITQIIAAAGARACGGQQHDFTPIHGQDMDEDRYLATIALKAAALVEGACHAGALLAAAAPAVVEAYAQFGFHLGIALQLGNDLAGVSSAHADRNDLRAGKHTLPLIFALTYAPPPLRQELAGIYAQGPRVELGPAAVERVRTILTVSGALDYAWLMADIAWERALSCLERAGEGNAGALWRLVDHVHGI